ncbi:MAG: T9SS type A sorting domain-containing protein, partial [Flavobacteriales bacterium]|nr:T9SS type A sorting domain-containing protein [Flavobacteriales bacterium]
RITLHDAFGRLLQTSNSTGTNVELNTSELRAGVYFVVVENGATLQTFKWIKQ